MYRLKMSRKENNGYIRNPRPKGEDYMNPKQDKFMNHDIRKFPWMAK